MAAPPEPELLLDIEAETGPDNISMVETSVAGSTGLAISPVILPLDQNPVAVYLATLRPTGRRSMHQILNTLAELASSNKLDALHFPWHTLRYQHTAALKVGLADKGLSPASVNKGVAAMRRVLYHAWKLGLMSSEDYQRAADVSSVRSDKLPRGRALAGGELMALLKTCAKDKSPAGRRDAAMVAVLHSAGLRRSELVTLVLTDYDPEAGQLKIRGGKGGKDRLVYLNDGAEAALLAWLKVRGELLDDGPIFMPINKGQHIVPHAMTDHAVRKILKKRATEAGVRAFSPHDLRRTFISDLLDAGADISTVQKLAGHANVTTTARYDRRGEVAKKRTAALLQTPYTGADDS